MGPHVPLVKTVSDMMVPTGSSIIPILLRCKCAVEKNIVIGSLGSFENNLGWPNSLPQKFIQVSIVS